MRTRKRTSGSSRFRALLPLALIAAACLAASAPPKDKKTQPYAVIGGTVFRDTGFSLPGAQITVAAAEGAADFKFKRIKVIADARGEFAVRVPARPMRYTVSVKAGGYRPGSQDAAIQGEERVDLVFRLEPESK